MANYRQWHWDGEWHDFPKPKENEQVFLNWLNDVEDSTPPIIQPSNVEQTVLFDYLWDEVCEAFQIKPKLK